MILTLLATQSIAANAATLTEALDPSRWKQDITRKIALNYFSPSITAVIEDFVNNSNKPLFCKIQVASIMDIAMSDALSILNDGKLNEVAKSIISDPSVSINDKKAALSGFTLSQKISADFTAKEIVRNLSTVDTYCRN